MSLPPDISVVIPVYKGEKTLEKTLAAMFVSRDVSYEVIVVLDGPDRACRQIAGSYPTHLFELPRRSGSGAARNAGYQTANGRILLFIDADIEVEPLTLNNILQVMDADGSPDAIIGAYNPVCPVQNFSSQYKNLHHHFIHRTSHRNAETFWTGCGAVRTAAFKALNGFSTHPFVRNIADIEFGYRLVQAGYSIEVHPQIQVRHHKPYTFFSLLRSDLFERALPWTRIMWHHRTFRSGLNARLYQSFSTLLLILSPLLLLTPLSIVQRIVGSLGFISLLAGINREWIRYSASEKGGRFAAGSFAMEMLHFLVCGIGAALGTIVYLKDWISGKERHLSLGTKPPSSNN
jgi:GT2 family glycosyltransferase